MKNCTDNPDPPDTGDVDVSIVITAYNEADCIAEAIRELFETLSAIPGRGFEVIVVDDGSTDGTVNALCTARKQYEALRMFHISPNSGKSAALGVGFRHSRGEIIVTMDGDGQNDPADIPRCLDGLENADCCCGYRAARHATWSRRVGSRLANGVRNRVLGESIIDTGCGLKAFRSELLKGLPMWDGLHRFLPSLCLMQGARVKQIPVGDRPRLAGKSKYTNLGRLGKAVRDLTAVRWMKTRYRRFEVSEPK